MKKITMDEAQKMLRSRDTPVSIMHIDWFTKETGYSIICDVDLQAEHPDCSDVLVRDGRRWREPGSIVALVLKDGHTNDKDND